MQQREPEPQNLEPTFDALTGALTRASFVALLHEHAATAARSGGVFSLCLADLDRLRNVNDTRGASVGDQVLAGLAARLRSVLDAPAWHRSEYTFGRHDGGTLAVLARPCTANQAELLAEALRFGVSDSPLAQGVVATVSIGVAQHRIGETIDTLLARAERALHLAKQFGRDRVEIARTPPMRPERAKVVGIHDWRA
ncbi:MAG TPA: GGDEF domain-containing protein [Gammaproteobacteria bacterium]|nr:GGDEF domain-containing protein [Gammaproteobacteria bacterium]